MRRREPVLPPSSDLTMHRLIVAALVTGVFTAVATRWGTVTRSGAIVGATVAFVIYSSGGPVLFAVLTAVFILTVITTRIGYARKQQLGTAESKRGRTGVQIGANLGVAAACSATSLWFAHDALQLAALAALAEAAADTCASEIGQAWASRVYLITTFRRVRPGVDGGISLAGTLAALFAACVTAGVAVAGEHIAAHWLVAAVGAAMLGMFMDSLVGATLQQRGTVGNSTVNLIGTTMAALCSLLFLI